MHLPKQFRKESHSFVRARLDEMRTKRRARTLLTDIHGGDLNAPEHGFSRGSEGSSLPTSAVIQQHRSAASMLVPARPTIMTVSTLQQSHTISSPALTETSSRENSQPQSPAQWFNTPTSSTYPDSGPVLLEASLSRRKEGHDCVDCLWSPGSYSGHVVSGI